MPTPWATGRVSPGWRNVPAPVKRPGPVEPVGWVERAIVGLLVVTVAGFLAWYMGARVDNVFDGISGRLGAVIAPPAATVPPVGSIWFTPTLDPTTFRVTNPVSRLPAASPFVLVAHLPHPVDSVTSGLRVYVDGQLTGEAAVTGSLSGDLWAVAIAPLYFPGTWRYEVVDVDGNLLAGGWLTLV